MAKDRKDIIGEEVDQLTSTENFIDRFKKPLIIGGVAIVVVVLGYAGYQKFVQEPKVLAAQNEIWKPYYDFENDSLKTAVAGTDDYAGLEEIADDYSGTPSADIANYGLGIAAMKNKEFESAIDHFKKCDFEDIIVGNLTLGLIGDAYSELGEYEKAADYYSEAATREENKYSSPIYLMKAGLVYEKLGKREKALAAYEVVKNKWQDSNEAKEIDKYIARVKN
jgi:tetratricopeptide (TPR) repeat protein